MEILDEQKKKITNDLYNYVQNMADGSANKASQILSGVSNATISNVLNNKHEKVADTMWQNIKNQVSKKGEWQYVAIRPSIFIEKVIQDAAENSSVKGLVGIAGGCKSKSVLRTETNNVFVISCHEYFTSRDFLEAICEAMGVRIYSGRISTLMKEIVKHLLKLKNPVIIIDEADKLDRKVLYFFISLFNALEGKCGLIIQATHYLQSFIQNGVDTGKKGFQEIYSRIGQIFLEVPKINLNDAKKICRANGLTDDLLITEIFNSCNYDVRVIRNDVHAHLKKQ
jgi:hypothetical protein